VVGLRECRLANVVEMTVSGEDFWCNDNAMLLVDEELQREIEKMFDRNQDRSDGFTPCLMLKGFRWTEAEKFPKNWKIEMEKCFEKEKVLARSPASPVYSPVSPGGAGGAGGPVFQED
jgi:hypothetical protein